MRLPLPKAWLPVLIFGGLIPLQAGAEKTAQANSPILYGYNNASDYNATTTLPAGIYSFQASQNGDAALVADAAKVSDIPTKAYYAGGKYYMLEVVSSWFGDPTVNIHVYDATTWTKEKTVAVTGVVPGSDFCVSADGAKAYATGSDADWNTYLYEIDLSTGASTSLFNIGSLYYTGSCIGPDNKFYIWNSTDYRMRSYDLSTYTETVYDPETSPDLSNASFTYDNHAGCFYATGTRYEGGNIFKIDATTGAVTEIGTVPEDMIIVGVYLPEYAAGVPDAVSDVDFSYASAGAEQATLTFVMPSKTYGGETLNGSLTAVVTIDGTAEEVASQPGATVSLNKTFTQGNHIISIEVKNEAGTSPMRRFRTYCGLDAPAAVENLTFTLDEAGNSHVEWTAPTATVNGGSMDASSLNYKVVRNPNNVVVAENLKATSFDEVLANSFGHYTYTITPYAGELEGTPATTEMITWGDNNVPPFVETLEEWTDFERYTTFNLNEDDYGWSCMGGNASAYSNYERASDYWMFTPAITLDKDMTYTAAFDLAASSWENKSCKLEMSICDAPTLESAKTILIPEFETAETDLQTYVSEVTVPVSGTYYLAFHCTTEAGGAGTIVDNISMIPNSAVTAPAAVEDLTATPGAKGALEATLSFTAPSKNVDGSTLTTVDKIEINRYGEAEPIATLTDAAAGKVMSWTDLNAADGRNVYAVTPYSGSIKGMTKHIAVSVGTDIPGAVSSVTVALTADGKAVLTWAAPTETGANGGYVNPETVTYNIYRADDIDGFYEAAIANNVASLTYTDDTFVMPEGVKQNVVRYQITAVNEKGEGTKMPAIITFGEAYPTPMMESFAEAKTTYDGWKQVAKTGAGQWSIENGETTVVKPQDDDKGLLRFSNTGVVEGSATFRSPRIAIEGKELEVSFMMNHGSEVEPEDMDLTVNIIADDAAPIKAAEIAYADGTAGWQRHSVNLAPYMSAGNVVLEFVGRAADSSASIFVDNIKVLTKYDNDVELTGLTIPAGIELGVNHADVIVSNTGKNAATFDVILYKNNEEVTRETVENLPANESRSLSMDMNVLRTDNATTLTYRAEAAMSEDQYTDNNVSKSFETFVKRNTMPLVEIEGANNDNIITLTWDKPEPMMAAAINDGFEDYSPYALNNFGDWITVDADGKTTDFSKYWNEITNAKAAMAWEVWNTEQVRTDGFFEGVGVTESHFLPHSGNSALISFTAMEMSEWFGEFPTANDNWLVSPEVVGGTDISFWMKSLSSANPETVELYYTTETIDPVNPDLTKFVMVDRYSLLGYDWRQVSATLPADATRFAVRQCTESNGYIMMLDDFEFVPMSGELKAITPKGYNIYRNNELLGSAETETYTDKPTEDGSYTYFVTSLWEEGESAASNTFTTEAKGIVSLDGIFADGVRVSAGRGVITITADKAVDCIISKIDGSVIFTGSIAGTHNVDVSSGVYVVTVNKSAKKIFVK